jgi:hypothetical protein
MVVTSHDDGTTLDKVLGGGSNVVHADGSNGRGEL